MEEQGPCQASLHQEEQHRGQVSKIITINEQIKVSPRSLLGDQSLLGGCGVAKGTPVASWPAHSLSLLRQTRKKILDRRKISGWWSLFPDENQELQHNEHSLKAFFSCPAAHPRLSRNLTRNPLHNPSGSWLYLVTNAIQGHPVISESRKGNRDRGGEGPSETGYTNEAPKASKALSTDTARTLRSSSHLSRS